MKKIDFLVKALPLASIFLIMCSAVRLVIYYNTFNISITDYIQIQEYPTLFVDDILSYLLIFGIGIVIEVLNPYTQFIEKNTPPIKSISKNKKRNLLISMLIILLLITAVYLFVDDEILKLDLIKVLLYFLLINFHIYCEYTSINFNYIGLITSVVLVYTIFDAKIDSLKIMENKENLRYCIYLENNVIETNTQIHYLGKSEKYIFLFDTSSKISTVLPMEEVKEIHVIGWKE